jgi:uncharacterized repeat protein (TIGR03803 family)
MKEVAMIQGNMHRLAAVRDLVLTTLSSISRKSRTSIMVAALSLCGSGSLLAQTFTTLYLFGAGGNPDGGLVQGADGNLYGVTAGGPGKGDGMIFKINPTGTFTTLHSGGGEYIGALVRGTDGDFYGTVLEGGTFNHGTVFKISPSGALTTLHNFDFTDGTLPRGLVQASDGNFYGTTEQGGTNSCVYGGTNYGCGTLFKITPSGTLTTLYNFCSQSGCADGQIPVGPLVQSTDGNLYGTTGAGGTGPCSSGCGTVFKITPSGALTTLHSFELTDGAGPNGGPIQATDGDFYGTTSSGGTNNSNCDSGSCGTVFKMRPTGTLTTLHRFDYTDGANPEAALIQANDGNFYGTTSGTIFKITPTGTLTMLHTGVDANALVQDTNGTFYGTTLQGGRIVYHYCGGSCGTIFSLSVGLGPVR